MWTDYETELNVGSDTLLYMCQVFECYLRVNGCDGGCEGLYNVDVLMVCYVWEQVMFILITNYNWKHVKLWF